MTLVIGLCTLIGAILGGLVPVALVLLLAKRVKRSILVAGTGQYTREDVEAVFLLQGMMDALRESDTYLHESDSFRINWGHRLTVVLNFIKWPTLVGTLIGLVVDNIMRFY